MFLNKSNSKNKSLKQFQNKLQPKKFPIIPHLNKNQQLSWNTISYRSTTELRKDLQILLRRFKPQETMKISWFILKMQKEWSLMCFSGKKIRVLFLLKIIKRKHLSLSLNPHSLILINTWAVVEGQRRIIKFFLITK